MDFPVRIGRGAGVDVRVDDVCVSRVHCEIVAEGGKVVVHDLKSKNGTFVNGVRKEFSELSQDDVLSLGASRFVVQGSAIAGADSAVHKAPCSPKEASKEDSRVGGKAGRPSRIPVLT